ncbi:hypothetical protein PV646_41380 [Streptomyces sp. ID05-26A]|nr:hypothetical protein [Streptomyces sp. ID05-26A]
MATDPMPTTVPFREYSGFQVIDSGRSRVFTGTKSSRLVDASTMRGRSGDPSASANARTSEWSAAVVPAPSQTRRTGTVDSPACSWKWGDPLTSPAKATPPSGDPLTRNFPSPARTKT